MGERRVEELLAVANTTLAEAPSGRVDYAEIVDAGSLGPIERVERAAVCAVAVFFGNARLIDNRLLTKQPEHTEKA
jgi:pantoate--beta-alanine ligase